MSTVSKRMTGVALAMATAGMLGCSSTGSESAPSGAANLKASTSDLIHCYDTNICKGHNDCKTAANTCAGTATCKGTGFVGMPAKACADIGGTQKDNWEGTIAATDLTHCYGVNICKGHNDCKTAKNSCAGHASCNGTGFVSMPAKACADVGGKVGA